MNRIFRQAVMAAVVLGIAAFGRPGLASADPANLLTNGGAEAGSLAPWQNYNSAASIEQGNANSGSYSFKINGTGGVVYSVSGLTPNTPYTFSGYVKVQVTGEQARLTVQGFGISDSSVGAMSNGYQIESVTFTPLKADGQVAFWKDGGTGAAWGDDFALVAGTQPLTIAGSGGAAAASTAAGFDSGLISDGGFESGSIGQWQTYGSAVSIVQDSPHSGKYCAKIDGHGGGIYSATGLKPNTTYVFSGWGKVATPGEMMRLTVSQYGGADSSVVFTTSDYAQQSVTFTTGASNTTASVIFWKDSGSGAAWIDDLRLVAK